MPCVLQSELLLLLLLPLLLLLVLKLLQFWQYTVCICPFNRSLRQQQVLLDAFEGDKCFYDAVDNPRECVKGRNQDVE
jgi:hypothetical protein